VLVVFDLPEFLVEPAPRIFALLAGETRFQFPVGARLEGANRSSRSTTMASVGVCTRPTVVRWKPPVLELNAVIARVPLMPISQSLSARLIAAARKPAISSPARRLAKPSRIALWVIDCNHSRRTGFLVALCWAM
jgi:hypothetical protein